MAMPRQGGMVGGADAYRALFGYRRIADGHVVASHLEDQHVLILDGLFILGQQQTEVVEHGVFVAVLLIGIFGLGRDNELQLGGLGIDLAHLKHGLPAIRSTKRAQIG